MKVQVGGTLSKIGNTFLITECFSIEQLIKQLTAVS